VNGNSRLVKDDFESILTGLVGDAGSSDAKLQAAALRFLAICIASDIAGLVSLKNNYCNAKF